MSVLVVIFAFVDAYLKSDMPILAMSFLFCGLLLIYFMTMTCVIPRMVIKERASTQKDIEERVALEHPMQTGDGHQKLAIIVETKGNGDNFAANLMKNDLKK